MQLNVLGSSHRWGCGRSLLAVVLAALLAPGDAVAIALQQPAAPAQVAAPTEPEVKISPDQLDSLVAPVALYPDPLLGQVLVASTYPLEIVQLQQWLVKNEKLKDKASADAVAKQPWDPSIQSMAALPDVVKRLADEIQWTTDLGNAFLSQQSDVMDAVQRMRKKAQDKGALKTSEHMKVETQVIENKSVIIVEQAQPEVIYVPSYDPVVVYGAPAYPYPPLYYPPYYGTGAAVAAGVIGFGVGLAIGAAWGGGGWGYGCGWGGGNINVNMNNNFQRNNFNNVNGGNRNQINGGNRANGGNTWSHNSAHRGGAPYANQRTAEKFGGTSRGASAADRQSGARQQLGRQGGNVSNSAQGLGGGGNAGNRSPGGGSPGVGTPGGGDRVGNRSVSPRSSGGSSSFGGGGGGTSGAAARSNSSRGSSSMGRSSGGAARSGGGGRTGGGGGRRR